MRRSRRATLTGALALVAGVTLPLSLAEPAVAGTTSVPTSYRCLTTAFDTTYDSGAQTHTVVIAAPSSAEVGSTVILRWQLDEDVPTFPLPLEDFSSTTTMSLDVSVNGGAATQRTVVGEPTDPADLAAFEPIPMERAFRTTLPITQQAGDVLSLTPGEIKVDFVEAADEDLVGLTMTCAPDSAPTAVTINVRAPAAVDPENACTEIGGICAVSGENYADDTLRQEGIVEEGDSLDGTIQLGQTTSSSGEQEISGELNPIRVTDLRSGAFGWSLTARLEDGLVGQFGATIPADRLRLEDLSCDESPGAHGSAPAVAGAGGSLDDDVTMCSVDDGATGSGGSGAGQYDIRATVVLDTPKFAQAGEYSGVLVINLS